MQNNTERFSNYSRIRGVIEIPYEAVPQPTKVVAKEERQTEEMLAVKKSQYTAWEEFITTSGP